jgi:preprotein translocase subunit YajC
MSPSSFAVIFAQVSNAASSAATDTAAGPVPGVAGPQAPWWTNLFFPVLIMAMVYFALIRPQVQAKKKQDETIKGARTGDKIITSSGIHGLITNVKDTTVIVKVADNVKLEIEKTHIDKITRADSGTDSEKPVATKAS